MIIRQLSDPVLYTNFLFIILGLYVGYYLNFLYMFIGISNFFISGYYHRHCEQRFKFIDKLYSKICVGIFIYDSLLLFKKFPVLIFFNVISNFVPLIYCFISARQNKVFYDKFHIGVHYFAPLFALFNHYLKYHCI